MYWNDSNVSGIHKKYIFLAINPCTNQHDWLNTSKCGTHFSKRHFKLFNFVLHNKISIWYPTNNNNNTKRAVRNTPSYQGKSMLCSLYNKYEYLYARVVVAWWSNTWIGQCDVGWNWILWATAAVLPVWSDQSSRSSQISSILTASPQSMHCSRRESLLHRNNFIRHLHLCLGVG